MYSNLRCRLTPVVLALALAGPARAVERAALVDEVMVNPIRLAHAGEHAVTTPGRFEGLFCTGTGDVEFLRLIDESFAFFHSNPVVPSLGMLYQPEWDLLIQGANWDAWWIQNSYGLAYAATPFLQEPWFSLMQKSFDLFWDNQGDGKRRGKLVGPATGSYHGLVGPDGCLGDCALPGIIAYKQGDGPMSVHEWFYEATAAGVVIQAEILLASRDRKAIERYLPKMERACDFIEKARDPKNHLFLVGPACNLLAPSYGGVKQPDGSFGKGYLAGLSITYLAALDRMVELLKLAGGRENLANYGRRQKITRESLQQLLTPAGYFVKSIEPGGVKHGVLGQKQFGYLEGVANADAVALRVVDDRTARSIYQQIAGFPAIRPFDFLLVNAPGLDDTYWNWGHTSGPGFEGFHAFGDWVNGGAWSTVEGRAILMYYRLGKFEDIRRSASRAMKWAKDFRMDQPWSQRGENSHNSWSDSGQFQVGGVVVCSDNFAIPASTIRGLFDYDYRSDRLILRPRVPGSITQYAQKEPIRFGSKRLYVSCHNSGPKVASVRVNGQPWTISSPEAVILRFDELPSEAKVEIATEGGWPTETPTVAYPGTPAVFPMTDASAPTPSELPDALKQPFKALTAMRDLLAAETGADYELAFIRETMELCKACAVRARMDPGPGYYRPITPDRRKGLDQFFEKAALGMYHGFARSMSVYARRGDARQKRVAALFAQIPDAPLFPRSVRHAAVDKPVTLHTKCSDNYPGDGPASFTDGLLARTDHTDAAWLGFQEDCVATIDSGEPAALGELAASFLQNVAAGIFLPRQVEFWVGNDLAKLQLVGTVKPVTNERDPGPIKETIRLKDLHQRARYVQMRAANRGEIPFWHPTAGRKAWLFIDEILIHPSNPGDGAGGAAH